MKTKAAVIVLAFLLLAGAARADEPSVAVRTEALRQHRLTDTLVGYGVVVPETGRVMNVNFPRAGRIAALRVSLGQRVARGDPLFEVQTDPAANLAYSQAENAVALARGDLARIEELAREQLATQSQVAAARKALADAEAQLQAQRRLGTGSALTVFKAPFAGVVSALSAAPGDRVAAGATVLQLARTDALRVQLGIEPEDAVRVKPGMPVKIASVFDSRNAVQAQVARVQGMINPQTQLVDVVVVFRNTPASHLLPGTRVRGDITVQTQHVWAVPRQAVLRDAKGAYLFQVKSGRALRVNVTTGIEDGGLVGIRGSLDPSLPVVVLGNYELKDGMAVREERP